MSTTCQTKDCWAAPMAPISRAPFSSRYQLRQHIPPIDFVSEGQATLSEDEDLPSLATVRNFLQRELDTPILNEFHPHISLVAKKAGDHITPLHRQRIQRRNIIIAEDPALQLVWYYDTLYLKPIPQCLYNYPFWEKYLLRSTPKCPGIAQSSGACFNSRICRTALGYLRSYFSSIWHEPHCPMSRPDHERYPLSGFQTFHPPIPVDPRRERVFTLSFRANPSHSPQLCGSSAAALNNGRHDVCVLPPT